MTSLDAAIDLVRSSPGLREMFNDEVRDAVPAEKSASFNYQVTIYSRLGMRSEILKERRIQTIARFAGILEAIRWMEAQASVHGWRDFSLVTVGDSVSGIPLSGGKESK